MIYLIIFFIVAFIISISLKKYSDYKKKFLKSEIEVSKNAYAEVLKPGLVVLRNVIDEKDQIALCRFADRVGSGRHGTKDSYWQKSRYKGKKLLNYGTKGRVYHALSYFPDGNFLKNMCIK